MKRQYTKKQIIEAIAFWEKQLKLKNCKDNSQLRCIVESADDDYYTMFIGNKNHHDKIRTPTIDQPLFLAVDIEYAYYYTDGHTAICEDDASGYIQVVKFPKSYLDNSMLNLTSDMKKACDILGFPDVMTTIHMHCAGMQWYASVVVGQLINTIGKSLFNAEDIKSRKADLSFCCSYLKSQLSKLEYVSKSWLASNAPEITPAAMAEFIEWAKNNEDLKALLPVYFSSARPSSIKETYKLTAALYFKPLSEKGYKAFCNLEGEGSKLKSWCVGIIDENFSKVCTCKCYQADDPKLKQYDKSNQ